MPSASGGGGVGSSIETGELANDSVTYAKIQNVSATDKVLGRSTAGAGDVEEIACTAAGRSMIAAATAAAQATLLGQGFTLLSTTAITTQATQTITPPFSSTYANYLIVMNLAGSTAIDIRMQMDATGTPATTEYYSAGRRMDYANAGTDLGTTNVAYWTLGQAIATNQSAFAFTLFRPNVAAITKISGVPMTEGTSTLYASFYGALINNTTQYDGFKLLASSGTMTGTVKVYGLN